MQKTLNRNDISEVEIDPVGDITGIKANLYLTFKIKRVIPIKGRPTISSTFNTMHIMKDDTDSAIMQLNAKLKTRSLMTSAFGMLFKDCVDHKDTQET